MTMSQALASVSQIYQPGVAKFFNGMNPDPWFQAHEDFEVIVRTKDSDLISAAADRFVDRCKELVELFKKQSRPPSGISSADALYGMSENRVRSWQSIKHKICFVCSANEFLKIVKDPNNENSVVLICESCIRRSA